MEEIWKDVPNYEGLYQVSNLGNVKSLPRKVMTKKGYFLTRQKILKPILNSRGYYCIGLYKNKTAKIFKIHQLIAIVFLNHKPCGMKLVIDHINDIPTDNRVENLQILTNRENTYKTQGKYSSKYKGVCLDKLTNKWLANISISGKRKFLGRFNCELAAHLAYQEALKSIQ